MKNKILILIGFFFISVALQAQTTNPALVPFEGTWKWGQNNDSIIIIFEQQTTRGFSEQPPLQSLIGWHMLKKNGIIVQNSLPFAGSNYQDGFSNNNVKSSFFGWKKNTNYLYLFVNDITTKFPLEVFAKILPGLPMQLECEVNPRGSMWQTGHSMPKHFTLTKQ